MDPSNSPTLIHALFALVGAAANAAVFVFCFARLGKSFLGTVARVSIPSVVFAVGAHALFRIDSLGAWAEGLLFGIGAAGAIAAYGAFMRLAAPPPPEF